ncbi:helix-turn-helix domain-containing protein [Pediococcus pentosaceus]|uniref:helix-turn-helix domain-containing protein n=1 Tax=Pediococcus pentosaceus TaxID=1255 RepID=UPI000CFF245E|nr:helix-turn-helix transcriptional regulator [Pediococcus pentosaceus]AVL02825.1 transcriptional regulator [Pediococcus pentosaceus]MBF7133611.1 helix-turn-helix transcriptional regulator [Pediococcus pentosaceus]QPT36948.1 helix-turn-helix transcriptional regulator [Pediococcus pentosaceus]
MTLFDRVKKISKQRGYSLAELARKADIGEKSIYTWKPSKTYPNGVTPSRKTLEAVAKVLHVTVDYLLGKNETPDWANENDTKDLEAFLERNLEGGMTYGGEDLTEEEKQQVKLAMTTIFWKRHKHD